MNQSALALDYSAIENPVVAVARTLADILRQGVAITRTSVSQAFTRVTGATDADGRWSLAEAHAAVELAQLLWLQRDGSLSASSDSAEAFALFSTLEALTPIQHKRSEDQVRFQQFSTPVRLAWIAARAAGLSSASLTLEPSAGTGMMAFWAMAGGSRLTLNEIDPLRREALGALFPDVEVSCHDGELIDDLLDPAIKPDTVLINPPFSVGLERGGDGLTGARHLRSAVDRLSPGGRAVAIMPEWFDCPALLARSQSPIAVRLNVSMDGAFARAGTSISTRLLVIDKVAPSGGGVAAHVASLDELVAYVDALPPRLQRLHRPLPSMPPALPLRLAAQPVRRPLAPLAPKGRQASAAALLEYHPLPEPAPIAEQVGHYLPYRPSRIAIPGAAPHPTPLVESVAMGSIAAPIPVALPLLTANCVSDGLLSEAQLETLIYAANAFGRDLPGTYAPIDRGCALQASAEGPTYRCGFFLGDGTGAGKGRQLAGVFLDRWLRGERRHIWLSKNEALLEDARRDWCALGGLPLDIQPLSQWKLDDRGSDATADRGRCAGAWYASTRFVGP